MKPSSTREMDGFQDRREETVELARGGARTSFFRSFRSCVLSRPRRLVPSSFVSDHHCFVEPSDNSFGFDSTLIRRGSCELGPFSER